MPRYVIRAPARAPDAYQSVRQSRGNTGKVTLNAWRRRIRDAGEKAIPAGDPLFDYADRVGLDPEMLPVQWHQFVETYTNERNTKLYTDWRKAFRNSVRQNWFRLWYVDRVTNAMNWTSTGLQALADYKAMKAAQAAQQLSQQSST